MYLSKSFVRFCSLLLIAAIFNSCVVYSPFLARKDPPPSFEGRVLRLIWEGKTGSKLYMTGTSIKDAVLSGTVTSIEKFPHKKNKQLINVYIDPSVAKPASSASTFSLPLSGIRKIEVYDLDLGKTIVGTFFLIGGVGVLLSGIALLLVAIFKESCPFVYVWNGHEFEFRGEIYSGAIFPSLERHDYMALPGLHASENEYRIKLTNQVQEIQYTNLAELCVVDHPRNTEVL
ncbi:MAG TPA: hypothetical protein P5533_02990, partial [Candidatus Cloacimonadota bacterium]|nr:hypothetical protein [Candidatus Cloacimonadota bacterium]